MSSFTLLSERPHKTLNVLRTLTRFSTTATPTIDEALPIVPLAVADHDDPTTAVSAAASRPRRFILPHRRRNDLERPDELVCYMMATRRWTTRLENSIRKVLPFPLDTPFVLSVLRRARSPVHALNFFRLAERRASFCHDRDTYLEIIRILSRASMLNHARCILLDDIPKRSPSVYRDESMFAPLIVGYGSAGIPQESVKLFRRMPDLGVPRTLPSYEAFFRAILRRGRAMMAKRAFNAMLRDGVTPTVYTYNIMIWGFCLSEMMTTATRFFQEMRERGVDPDVVTYNTLIGGWVRARRTGDARKLFDEIPEKGLARNTISYSTMIKGYVQEEDMGEALRLFWEMEEARVPLNEKTFAVLLQGLCEDMGTAGEARRLLEVMAERHIRPKEDGMFLKLIACLCGAGRMGEAVEVLRLVDRFRLKVSSAYYNTLVEGFCKAGMHTKAVEMVDEVLQKGVLSEPCSSVFDAAAYNPIIAHMCANGLAKKADTFFRLLLKKGVDDAVAFNHLIRGYSSEGSPEYALELLTIMTHRGVASDAYTSVLLVESFLRKGEAADAKTVLDTMMEQGHVPSSSLFRSVMESLFNNDRVQTASRVMKSMIEKGVKDNKDVVHKILEELFMRGHVEEALGRINLMMENDCFPEIDRLLNVLCEKNKITTALELADFGLERDCDISFESYDRVLGALSADGKTLNAYSLLCKIKSKGGHTNKEAAAALLKSLIDEGNTKQADSLSRLIFSKERRGRATSASAV